MSQQNDNQDKKLKPASNDPVFWLSFGMSGTFCAFVLPAVIIVLCLLPALKWIDPAVVAWLFGSKLGGFLIGGVALFLLWNCLHRIKYLAHDLQWPIPSLKVVIYAIVGGVFTLLTILAVTA